MNSAGGFVLCIRLHIANCSNCAALIDGFFNLFGQANILYLHLDQLQTHRFKICRNPLAQHIAQHADLGFEVNHRKPQLGHHFLDAHANLAAQVFLNFLCREAPFRPGNIFNKNAGVLDTNRVEAEGRDTHDAELFVAHG